MYVYYVIHHKLGDFSQFKDADSFQEKAYIVTLILI